MIGILLNNLSFEQDIRELLMAFYPGESFVLKETQEEKRLIVYGKMQPSSCELTLHDPLSEITKTAVAEGDFSDRTRAKNRIKRMLYILLKELTGKELPWGTLTGIRPVKLAEAKLLAGWDEEVIRDYMKDTYFTSEEKIDLSLEIAARERKLLSGIHPEGYSLYIGIPFCPTTCLYCSFPSFPIGRWESRMGEYFQALFREMEHGAEKMWGKTLDTVYIGGGTPTSLSAFDLERLLEKLTKTYDCSALKEFTVEAGRPDSITREKLAVLQHYGVTRISVNPQTMNQKTLDLIGRRNTADMVKERFWLARELGFDNINMDLIVGLPGETMEDLVHTMEEIKALGPEGITVHSLALKRAARLNMFKEQYENLTITNTREMFEYTAACAKDMGLLPYYLYRQKNMAGNFENVGYSLPGKACVYNILIMEEKQTILACGAGTTTKAVFPEENRLERTENVKEVEQYISRIEEMLERKEKILAKTKKEWHD